MVTVVNGNNCKNLYKFVRLVKWCCSFPWFTNVSRYEYRNGKTICTYKKIDRFKLWKQWTIISEYTQLRQKIKYNKVRYKNFWTQFVAIDKLLWGNVNIKCNNSLEKYSKHPWDSTVLQRALYSLGWSACSWCFLLSQAILGISLRVANLSLFIKSRHTYRKCVIKIIGMNLMSFFQRSYSIWTLPQVQKLLLMATHNLKWKMEAYIQYI